MADIAFGLLSLGVNILSSGSAKADQRRQQIGQYDFQKLQATSDAATSRSNAAITATKRDAYSRQQGEVITDITQQGESVYAERAALAAAEGFGGGGTARSVQAGIRRKVNRDVTRVRDSLTEQTSIFNLQQQQQLDQATAFDLQASFAGKQSGNLNERSKFNDIWDLFRPSTWFQ